jgi:hypothetical protein
MHASACIGYAGFNWSLVGWRVQIDWKSLRCTFRPEKKLIEVVGLAEHLSIEPPHVAQPRAAYEVVDQIVEAAHAEHHARFEFDGRAMTPIFVQEFQQRVSHDLELPKGFPTSLNSTPMRKEYPKLSKHCPPVAKDHPIYKKGSFATFINRRKKPSRNSSGKSASPPQAPWPAERFAL